MIGVLSGCAMFGERGTVYEADLTPKPPSAQPMELRNIRWISDSELIAGHIESGGAMMCLNMEDYRFMRNNMTEIARFLFEQRAIIRYYENRNEND